MKRSLAKVDPAPEVEAPESGTVDFWHTILIEDLQKIIRSMVVDASSGYGYRIDYYSILAFGLTCKSEYAKIQDLDNFHNNNKLKVSLKFNDKTLTQTNKKVIVCSIINEDYIQLWSKWNLDQYPKKLTLLKWALESNATQMFQKLQTFSLHPDNVMIEMTIRRNQLEFLQVFYDQNPNICASSNYFITALQSGHERIINWMLLEGWNFSINTILLTAMRYGSLPTVRRVYNHARRAYPRSVNSLMTNTNWTNEFEHLFGNQKHRLAILTWFIEHVTLTSELVTKIIKMAVGNQAYECLEFLFRRIDHTFLPEFDGWIYTEANDCSPKCQSPEVNPHLLTFKALWNYGIQFIPVSSLDSRLQLRYVAQFFPICNREFDVAIMEWLYNHGWKLDTKTFEAADTRGSYDLIKWLYDHNCLIDPNYKLKTYKYSYTNLEEWIEKHFPSGSK